MNRYVLALVLSGGLVSCEFLSANPHPLHDDGGAVNWKPSMAAALKAAKDTGKPIFIDAGTKS